MRAKRVGRWPANIVRKIMQPLGNDLLGPVWKLFLDVGNGDHRHVLTCRQLDLIKSHRMWSAVNHAACGYSLGRSATVQIPGQWPGRVRFACWHEAGETERKNHPTAGCPDYVEELD